MSVSRARAVPAPALAGTGQQEFAFDPGSRKVRAGRWIDAGSRLPRSGMPVSVRAEHIPVTPSAGYPIAKLVYRYGQNVWESCEWRGIVGSVREWFEIEQTA